MQTPTEVPKPVLASPEKTAGLDRRSALLGIAASIFAPILATLASAEEVADSPQPTHPELSADFEAFLAKHNLLKKWEEVSREMTQVEITTTGMEKTFDQTLDRNCPLDAIDTARSAMSKEELEDSKGIFYVPCSYKGTTISGNISVTDGMLDVRVRVVTNWDSEVHVDDTRGTAVENVTRVGYFRPPLAIRVMTPQDKCIAKSRLNENGIASFSLKDGEDTNDYPLHIEFCKEDDVLPEASKTPHWRFAPGHTTEVALI